MSVSPKRQKTEKKESQEKSEQPEEKATVNERGHLTFFSDHNHPRQKRIWFKEEGHTYGVDWTDTGNFETDHGVSVSSLGDGLFGKFDEKAQAKSMTQKARDRLPAPFTGQTREEMKLTYQKLNPKLSESEIQCEIDKLFVVADLCLKPMYRGMTEEEIIQSWWQNGENAKQAGTVFHLHAEKLLNHATERRTDVKPGSAYTQLYAFLDSCKLKPFLTEPLLFDEKRHITGSPDILYFSDREYPDTAPDQPKVLHLQIGDYKNSKAIKFFGFAGKKAQGFFSHLQDCNGTKYNLQLNCYKRLLEYNYTNWKVNGVTYDKVVIDRMFLIVCHDNHRDGKCKIFEVPEMTKETDYLFERRRQQFMQNKTK